MQIKGASPIGFFIRGGLGLTAFFAFALLLYGCSKGTETEDPWELAGYVEHKDGEIAVGARVTAVRNDAARLKSVSRNAAQVANDPVDAVETDADGRFKFDSLPEGSYTLFFDYFDGVDSSRIQAHRIDGVYAHPGFSKSLDTTRLQTAAILTARAYNMVDSTDVEGAECRIDNTPYRATTVEFGLFLLYALPGTYKVRCEKGILLSQPYEVKLDSGRVASERIPMTEGGLAVTIPVPTNVTAILDSSTGIVRVSWSKPVTNELIKYRIRRLEIDKTNLLVGWESVTDTIQYDPVFAGEPDTVTSKLVQYNVASKRGAMYSDAVSSKPTWMVRGPSAKVGFLDTAQTSCVVGDTAKLLGTYKSRLNHNARVLWTMRSTLDTLQDTQVDNRQGSDTLSFPCLAPGNPSLEFRVKDETGITSITLFKFGIVSPP